MSLFGTAQTIYAALRDDQSALDAIRAERNALARSIATSANGAAIVTSATMNGQTFTAMQTLKPADRLKVLSIVCSMADTGQVQSTTVQALL